MNRLIYGHNWAQISVETGHKNIKAFAASLRRCGYNVTTFGMGYQVTNLGSLKLTMVDVRATYRAPLEPEVINDIARRYGF